MEDTSLERVLSRSFIILKLFLEDPDQEQYLEKLHEISAIPKMTLSRMLSRMFTEGIITAKEEAYRKRYQLSIGYLTPALKLLVNLDTKLIRELTQRYERSTLILYGSRAKGTNKPQSDWDLILIDDEENPLSANAFVSEMERRYSQRIDLRIYSREQFDQLKKERSPFYMELLKNMYVLNGGIDGI